MIAHRNNGTLSIYDPKLAGRNSRTASAMRPNLAGKDITFEYINKFESVLKDVTDRLSKLLGKDERNERANTSNGRRFLTAGAFASGLINSATSYYTAGQTAQGNIGAGLAGTIIGNGYDLGSKFSLVTMNRAQEQANKTSAILSGIGIAVGGGIGALVGGP